LRFVAGLFSLLLVWFLAGQIENFNYTGILENFNYTGIPNGWGTVIVWSVVAVILTVLGLVILFILRKTKYWPQSTPSFVSVISGSKKVGGSIRSWFSGPLRDSIFVIVFVALCVFAISIGKPAIWHRLYFAYDTLLITTLFLVAATFFRKEKKSLVVLLLSICVAVVGSNWFWIISADVPLPKEMRRFAQNSPVATSAAEKNFVDDPSVLVKYVEAVPPNKGKFLDFSRLPVGSKTPETLLEPGSRYRVRFPDDVIKTFHFNGRLRVISPGDSSCFQDFNNDNEPFGPQWKYRQNQYDVEALDDIPVTLWFELPPRPLKPLVITPPDTRALDQILEIVPSHPNKFRKQ